MNAEGAVDVDGGEVIVSRLCTRSHRRVNLGWLLLQTADGVGVCLALQWLQAAPMVRVSAQTTDRAAFRVRYMSR